MHGLLIAGTAATMLIAQQATAKDAAPLPASSKWQADFGKTECRLLRTFGEGRDRVTLQFSQIDSDPVVAVSLSAPRIPATDARKPGKVLVAATPVDIEARGFAAQSGLPPILEVQPSFQLRQAMMRAAEADQPTLLGVEFVRDWTTTLDLGRMKAPLAALDRCVDGMVRSWGLDPAEQRARRAGPAPADGSEA